jgi:mannose-6-phosphate isomerase-like protein (cupin superfamily)
MEFIDLNQQIDKSKREKIRNAHLFEAANFRSWLLCFEPGEGTPMHYHQSPETFLVLEGSASIKWLDGGERIIRKNEVVFLGAKDYYQITSIGPGPVLLFGNRSESFGHPPVKLGQEQSTTA